MATTASKQRRRETSFCPPSRPRSIEYKEMESRSLVEICGTYKTKCGYCKPNTKTSVSYGLLAKRLTCSDYQELIDRGWRRSGTFVYKPVMHETCCPQYTIRLDVTRFKHTKGQRQVLNRLRRYLDGDRDGEAANASRAAYLPDSSNRKKRSAATDVNGSNGNGNGNGNGVDKNIKPERTHDEHDDAGRQNSDMVGVLNERVAAAIACMVEGGAISGLDLGPDWRSKVTEWSQVRPFRNKKMPPISGRFCCAVALSVASVARKRGWKGSGSAGGAVAIAEAVSEILRAGISSSDERVVLSGFSVAPNGFINFEAKLGTSSMLASTTCAHDPPPHPLHQARADEALTPPATPPSPPGSNRLGSSLLRDSSSFRDSAPRMTPTTNVNVGSKGLVSSAGSEISAADGGTEKEALASSPDTAAMSLESVPVEQAAPRGQAGTMERRGGDGSFAPTTEAARLEWVQRQGEKGDASMDVEVSSASPSGAGKAGLSGLEARTGLASLPPLNPDVASHSMTISTVPARVTDEVFRLYVKYQVSVHGDDPSEVTPGQFRRFLVDSPLIRETVDGQVVRPSNPSARLVTPRGSAMIIDDEMEGVEGEDECSVMKQGKDSLSVPYGSYHQLYRIDGRLVAVGVVDILPKCLSSVYCFYDPDYRALTLGKLTALKETEFIREARTVRPALRDYYMGFYIHTCPKMSYKGSYNPSFLLCPERLTWVPLDLCRPVLDKQKYARLSNLLESSQLAGQSTDTREAWSTEMGSGQWRDDASAATGNREQRRGVGLKDGRGPRTAERRSPGSGSSHVMPSLPTDERDVAQDWPREVAPSTSLRPSPGNDAGMKAKTSGGDSGTAVAMTAARRAAVRRATAARAARAAADESSGINEIPLMVGNPTFPVNLTALTPHSQSLVRDALRTYVAAVGSDLAKRVVLKLRD